MFVQDAVKQVTVPVPDPPVAEVTAPLTGRRNPLSCKAPVVFEKVAMCPVVEAAGPVTRFAPPREILRGVLAARVGNVSFT
jgi:hypothetical protein